MYGIGQNLEDRVAVVTGASAGVGRATAIALAEAGVHVGIIARHEEGLAEVARLVESHGVRCAPVSCDVADAESMIAAADRISEALGPIDIWVNCAMATVFARFEDIAPDEYARVTNVCYLGMVNGTRAALRHMRPRDRGLILQVGSALAYRSIPLQSPYCGAKHAIVGFTDSLRSELLKEKSSITITAVHLPAVNTPQFAWGRAHVDYEPRPAGTPVAPEVAGEAIVSAIRNPRRDYWLGLQTAQAILGGMVAPGLLDRFLAWTAYEGQFGPDRLDEDRPDNLFTPVGSVDRERGPYADEEKGSAVLVSGAAARFALAGVVVGALVGAGFALRAGTRNGNRLPRPPARRAMR
ncbi:SDR family oxidoreductase [Microvirga lenta]|uniref:SDR family oxidoreductase n=1 Tax=Microvirga lenta TaxID=2881337 RepID=UPI001CFFD842|nr:SDR family oxidoreductase [Microvirga lenta]MCB5175395.1 SDR family oxidoreductase [Microvirga lenta]